MHIGVTARRGSSGAFGRNRLGVKMDEAQIRLDTIVVRALDRGQFIFRDTSSAGQIQTIDDEHIPALIEFLYKWSDSAKKRLRLEVLPNAIPAPYTTGNRSSTTKKQP